jgi:hypothetical protein
MWAVALRIYLQVFGVLLLLGGSGHAVGIVHLYTTQGVPDANRVLLDVWVAEAQLLGGGLYVAASVSLKSGPLKVTSINLERWMSRGCHFFRSLLAS